MSLGFVLWFSGLPASGKTTLARAVQQQLAERSIQSVIFDSDELRQILTPTPTYSEKERDWFYTAIAGLATLLAQNGVNLLIAATANRAHYRQQARQQIARFAEVYVHCSLETCRQRDPKGIYQRAVSGAATQVPGVGAMFEIPNAPEVTVDSETLTPEQGARQVIEELKNLIES
ncbi:MAG: adenylyl-sulfate kinase [Caldilineaceae bacterium]